MLYRLSLRGFAPVATACLLTGCGGSLIEFGPASSSASSSVAGSSSKVSSQAASSLGESSQAHSSAASSSQPASLLTSSGQFANGQENFTTYFFNQSATATFTDFFNVAISNVTPQFWEVQLQHRLSIVAQKTYVVCYQAKATAERSIQVNIDKAGTPDYSSLAGGGFNANLTQQWQSYSHSFTASGSDDTAHLTLSMGQSLVGVSLDNIGVYPGTLCPSVQLPQPQLARCDAPAPVAPIAKAPVGVNLNAPKTEPMIPKWGLGYMQSQWGYDLGDGKPFNYDTQEGFLNHAKALRGLPNPYGNHTHPADVMVLDMYWCGGGEANGVSCWDWPKNMLWDFTKYPNPKAMIDELHKMNFKVMMNYHEGGFATHESEWLAAMQSHFEMGMDIPWLDFWGEGAYSEGKVWSLLGAHLGSDKRRMYMGRHLALPNTENAEGGVFVNGIFQNGTGKTKYPDESPIEKTMPVHWTGDVEGTWLGLEQTIESIVYGPDGAMGGWSYLHSDTPGHSKVIGEKDKELAVRWIQFSDFSTTTRNHGWAPRSVWSWGQEAEEASYFSRMLRYRLLPYTYTYINRIWEKAIPLTMPMKYAYPGQADDLKFQFMFGDELLVAPLYRASSEINGRLPVFLPQGEQWVDYWSHTVYSGKQTVYADVSLANLKHVPLYVKRGAIIPMGPEIQYIDLAQHPNPLTLDIYPKCSGKSGFTLHDDDGETLGYQRGAYARTDITVNKIAAGLDISVGASAGNYTGKPSQQNYILKINLIDADYKTLTLNGTPLVAMSDANSLLNAAQATGWAIDAKAHILYVRFSTATSAANLVQIR